MRRAGAFAFVTLLALAGCDAPVVPTSPAPPPTTTPPPTTPPPAPPAVKPPQPIAPPKAPEPVVESFDAVHARAQALVAAGSYREAQRQWEELRRTTRDPAVREAASVELERVVRLATLEDELRALEREPDLVKLAAWWRAHLDERGLAPVVRATETLVRERRERLAKDLPAARARLEDARARLAKAATPADEWAARLELAREASKKKPYRVTRLDARGFGTDTKGQKVESTWSERPELGLEVLATARRPGGAERARDLLDDARIALDVRAFEVARTLLAEHRTLVPEAPAIDFARLEKLHTFSGKVATAAPGAGPNARDERTRIEWTFASALEAHDFAPAGKDPVTHAIEKGTLVVNGYVGLARALEVDAGPIEVSAELARNETAPFLGLALVGQGPEQWLVDVVIEEGARVRVALLEVSTRPGAGKWKTLHSEPLAKGTGSLAVRLVATPGATLEAFVGGKKLAFTSPAVPVAIAFSPRLGRLENGGVRATFRNLSVTAPIRAGWLRKLEDEYRRAVASAIAKLRDAGNGPKKVELARTGAEDPIALAGMPSAALEAFARAKEALAKGDEESARRLLDEAVARGQPFAAALLLRARLAVDLTPSRALNDADAALAVLPDLPEALALRGLAVTFGGCPPKGTAPLAAALASRPDSPIVLWAHGLAALAQRDPDHPEVAHAAADEVALASLLAPGDPFLARDAARARRLAWGPFPGKSAARVATEHFVLVSDVSEKTLAAVRSSVEDAWQTFARAFPSKEPWTKGEVIVFFARGDYLDWAETFAPEIGPSSAGFYDERRDQLVLYEGAHDRTGEITKCVTVHEAFHQYASRVLPPLPTWLNEGLAESFGMDAAFPGRAGWRAKELEQARHLPRDRAAWRAFLAGSRDDFHDKAGSGAKRGAHYARAWIVASLLREDRGIFGGALARILETCRSGVSPESAADAAFTDEMLGELDTRFEDRVRTLLRTK